jgi:two-component system nitrate/nitrite response regulator NarL
MIRILIADDSPQLLQCIRKVIEVHPEWKVCGEASDGLEAVSQTAELTPDLVVLDLTMPKLNGFQAARTIHVAAPKLPLLLYTQHLFDTHLGQEARDSGFSGVVTKGSSDSLTAAIASLLQGGTFFPNAASALDIVADLRAHVAEPSKPEGPPDETI